VIWTDAVQAIILIGGAIVALVIISLKMPDGFTGIIQTGNLNNKFELGSFNSNLDESTFWVVLVYGAFINLQNFGVDQNYIQRYMTSRSLSEAKRSAFWGAILYIPVSMIFLFIGTGLYALYSSGALVLPVHLTDPSAADKIFPYFIANEMPPGITGLLLASIFAAGMSTISTSFNSSATILLTDYFQKASSNPLSEKQKLKVLYLSTAAVGFTGGLMGLFMISTKSALDSWWKFASVFSGGMLGLFLLGAFTSIKKSYASVVAVLCGIGIILWMSIANLFPQYNLPLSNVHPYLSIVLGTSVIFIVGFGLGSLLNKPTQKLISK